MDLPDGRRSRRHVLKSTALAATAGVAGCSGLLGDGDGTDTETPTPTPSPTPTSSPTPSPTPTPDRPSIQRQVVLRDRAAINHVRRTVTGEIVWPSFDVVDLVDEDLLGTWQSSSQALRFRSNRAFRHWSSDFDFTGEWATVRGTLYLYYDDGSEYEYPYVVDSDSEGVYTVLQTDSGEVRFDRTENGTDDRDPVDVAEDLTIFKDDTPTEEGGEIEGGSTGSGFIVSPEGHVVTNAHVVGAHREPEETLYYRLAIIQRQALLAEFSDSEFTDREREEVTDVLMDKFFDYYGENAETRNVSQSIGVLYGRATPDEDVEVNSWEASIETVGNVVEQVGGEPSWGRDVAVLKVDGQAPLPTVQLGDSSDLGTGDEIFVIGYPDLGLNELFEDRDTTLEPTLTSGVVSARRTLNSGVEAIQTDAAINGGNSGGPMYDGDGNVVGIATFGPVDVDIEQIQFGLPIEVAKGFMGEIGVENRKGELTEAYEKGLNAYWRGDCEGVEKWMGEVLDLWSDHPYAEDFIEDC